MKSCLCFSRASTRSAQDQGSTEGFPALQKPLAAIYVLNQDHPTGLLGRRDLFRLETGFFELASGLQLYLIIL